MGEVPSLYNLCIEAVKMEILLSEDELPPDIYELPQHLFDSLVTCLPPLALERLQEHMPLKSWEENATTIDCSRSKRRRMSYTNFNAAWRDLYMSRWPHLVKKNQTVNWLAKQGVKACKMTNDWQQLYWETHLQNCLDEAAEVALLPAFSGSIGEINISDAILGSIGSAWSKRSSRYNCAELSYHCLKFSIYVRYLKLQNVICVAESYVSRLSCECENFQLDLLKTCKLHRLEVHRIYSEEHVDTLCKLLNHNRQTLKSLEFIRCKLSSTFLNAICDSLCIEGRQTHLIEKFSIKASNFVGMDRWELPIGLESFLSSGRSLTSVILCENHLGQNFAHTIFRTLLGSASDLSILDLSENNIASSLSHIVWRSSCCSQSSSGLRNSFQSLSVLNLRGNGMRKNDAVSLKSALVHMPNLEILDISDNPIEDVGVKSLLSCLVEMSQRCSHFKDLRVENCELSCAGLNQLLDVLSNMNHSLDSLSLGGNDLGSVSGHVVLIVQTFSQAGAAMGKILQTGVKALDIEDVGLGSSGFMELHDGLRDDLKLVYINMSKNRGGAKAAKFLAELIRQAPELVAVNAGFNFIPFESFSVICSAMEVGKGKLEHVDLTGNTWGDQSAVDSVLSKYHINGESVVVLPSSTAQYTPYDDDP